MDGSAMGFPGPEAAAEPASIVDEARVVGDCGAGLRVALAGAALVGTALGGAALVGAGATDDFRGMPSFGVPSIGTAVKLALLQRKDHTGGVMPRRPAPRYITRVTIRCDGSGRFHTARYEARSRRGRGCTRG